MSVPAKLFLVVILGFFALEILKIEIRTQFLETGLLSLSSRIETYCKPVTSVTLKKALEEVFEAPEKRGE